ncbi:hypothetical protein BDZ94DRAFT_18348 [Collybia nuda]|uniref:Uncharacterized protein n=1 Tax=Collybia nuda TaxID=64659 RepID=A0A9P5YLB7_9AGAR|nr:hypothetical protein BDZ94DRAFT_18348 [Collybia nuda]
MHPYCILQSSFKDFAEHTRFNSVLRLYDMFSLYIGAYYTYLLPPLTTSSYGPMRLRMKCRTW